MPTIIINSEEELKQTFLELAHAVHNMRHAQKYWHQHFGATNRARKQLWETKVDGILNRLGMAEHQNTKSIIVYKE